MNEQYTVVARFEDGVEHSFTCGDEENILAAALRQDVRLLCQCRKAYCGSCKALCSEGDYELGERINVQVLPPDEEENGIVVTCDTYPRSDLVLEFPYTSDRLGVVAPATEGFARVQVVERISSLVYRLVLQATDGPSGQAVALDFIPGQYMEIGIPDSDDVRAFSLANTADEQGRLEFLIRIVPGGRFADYLLHHAMPGQTVKLRGPMGEFIHGSEDFALHVTSRPQVFVGGSTGLAPLVSMLRDLARRQVQGEFHLFFGMQDNACMFYSEELEALAHGFPGLRLHLALVEPSAGWAGFSGTSVAAFEQHFAGRADCTEMPEVYICGPGPMVEATLAACRRLNIPEAQIHREEFVASGS